MNSMNVPVDGDGEVERCRRSSWVTPCCCCTVACSSEILRWPTRICSISCCCWAAMLLIISKSSAFAPPPFPESAGARAPTSSEFGVGAAAKLKEGPKMLCGPAG